MKNVQKTGVRLFWQMLILLLIFLMFPRICMADQSDNENTNGVLPDNVGGEGIDVVFCIDNSGSMWSQQEIRDQAVRSICNLAVGSDIHIGGVYFAGDIYKTKGLTPMEKEEGGRQILEGFVDEKRQDENNRNTNIGNALEAARGLFEDQDASRQRFVILFSDGINENLAQDSAYKEAADRKTLEQAQLLQQENIPIYCVYLQKERNDEQYLRNLVNYFGDNSYDQERFKKVTEDQIDTLTAQFAQIFFSMQNDMKYRKVEVDSSGKMGFYVPELGINKIQLFMDGNVQYEAVLDSPTEAEEDAVSWTDGKSAYITVNNPTSGDWTLEITGDNKEEVNGSLAYYSYLTAQAEFIYAEQEEKAEQLYRKEPLLLRVKLIDENGDVIHMNSGAELTASVTLKKDNGETEEQNLSFSQTEENWESEEFAIDDYGAYTVKLNVKYQDLIDLNYTLAEGQIEGRAPVTYDKEEVYYGTRHQDEITFSLEKADMFQDPDGDQVTLGQVTQINKENPVEVEEQDGLVLVTAKTEGDIEFAINLQDETGLQSIATIKGEVRERGTMTMAGYIVIAVCVIIAILIIRSGGKRKKKKLEEQIWELQKRLAGMIDQYEQVEKTVKGRRKKEKEMETNLEQLLKSFRAHCEAHLTKWQMEDYKVPELLNQGEKLLGSAGGNSETSGFILDLEDVPDPRELRSAEMTGKTKGELKKLKKDLEEEIQSTEEKQKKLSNRDRIARDRYRKMEKLGDRASRLQMKILEMLNRPVTCDLTLEWGEYFGARRARQKGKALTGYYRLDDVVFLAGGEKLTLGDALKGETTGVYVYGSPEEAEEGLFLKGEFPFRLRETASGQEARSVKEALLHRGRKYTIDTESTGIMTLEVK